MVPAAPPAATDARPGADRPPGADGPPPAAPATRRGLGWALPSPRRLIAWLFAARMVLAVATLLGASLSWTESPDVSFIVTISVLLAFTVTAHGWWSVWVRSRTAGPLFLLVQAVVDLGLVTTLVGFTGGVESPLSALYVVVLAAYAVLLPLWAGIVVSVLASALYLGAGLVAGARLGLPFWGQVLIFNVVFGIVAALGARLRRAGAEQDTLEMELRRVRLEADDILLNIRSGVLTVDGLGRLAFINPTAERLLGIDGRTQVGLPVLDQLKPKSSELWACLVAGIRSGRKVNRAEGIVFRGDGTSFPIGLMTTTFARDTSQHPSVTALFNDISESKHLQELHLRAERLEAVASLSASLAHEIRNPLASIRSSVEQLAQAAGAGDDERVLATLIVREADRLSRLLSEFLDFSRVRAARRETVDLREVARAAVHLVQAHPDCHPDAVVQVTGPATMIDADEDLLHRVLVNLVLNAVQAAAGPVTVTVSAGPALQGDVPRGSGIEAPIRLDVRDDGPGIPADIRDRLFEPFVSGRPGGSGLGLAIVQRAVEAHRGLITVASEAGEGTTFTIFLPAKWSAEDVA
jgi:two-component system, NtrC family, sensor histidine kinase PilS